MVEEKRKNKKSKRKIKIQVAGSDYRIVYFISSSSSSCSYFFSLRFADLNVKGEKKSSESSQMTKYGVYLVEH